MKNFILFLWGMLCLYAVNKVHAQTQTVVNGASTTLVKLQSTGCVYNWTNDKPEIGLPESGTGDIASFKAVNTGSSPIIAIITATPKAPATPAYVYVANQLTNNVSVKRADTYFEDYIIKVGSEPYGIAVSPDNSKVFVTNRTSNTVSVIKTSVYHVITTINVGKHPEGIAVSPDSKKVYVTSYDDGTVTVINITDNTVIATITNVSLHPSGIVVGADGSHIYVTDASSNTVRVINTATNTLGPSINVGDQPKGIVVSPNGSRLYVANEGSNNVSVINTADNTTLTTVPVGTQPFGVAITPDGSKLYVSNGGSDNVSVINTINNTVIATPAVGSQPRGLSVSAEGAKVFVANFGADNTSVIATASDAVIATFNVGTQPFSFGSFTTGTPVCNGSAVTFTITVNPTPPSVSGTGPIPNLTTSQGVPSASGMFNVSGLSLTQGITVTPPPGYEVSLDNATFNNTVTAGAAGNMSSTPVYIRLKAADAMNAYTGNVIISSPGASFVSLPVSGTVTTPIAAIILESPVTGSIVTCAGTPSASPSLQQFSVSAVNLGGIFTASATQGFEVSLSENSGYAQNIDISNSGGDIATKTIYIRASAAALGKITGNITLSSPGAVTKTVAVKALAHVVPTADPVTDKTYLAGTATPIIKFTGAVGNTFNWTNDKPGIGLPTSGTGDINSFIPINTGATPIVAHITVVPVSNPLAYVTNFNDNSVSAINTLTNTVAAMFTVGSLPMAVSVNSDATRAYVANYSSGDVSVINTGSNTVMATVKVGTEPLGVTISADDSQVDSYSDIDKITTHIDAATNTVTGTTDGGDFNPGIAINNTYKKLYGIGIIGDVTVSSLVTKAAVAHFDVATNVGGVLVSTDNTRAYISNTKDNTVWVIDANSNAIIKKIPVGLNPHGMAQLPDGSQLYVTNSADNTVTVINTATLTAGEVIPVGPFPTQIGITTGTGCSGLPVTFTITILPVPPTIKADGTPGELTTTVGTPSPSASFDVSGVKLTDGVLVSPPAGYEVSLDNATFSPTVTVPMGTGGTISGVTVYIRLTGGAVGTYAGDIVLTSPGAAPVNVATTPSKVTLAIPTILVTPTTGSMFTCAGTPAASPNIQQFKITGTLLAGNITVTAPLNFEVSLSALSGFSKIVPVSPTGSTLAQTIIYVRTAASAAANVSGDVVITSPGALFKTAAVRGIVHPLPTVVQVANQTVAGGKLSTPVSFTGTGNTYNWTNDKPGIGLPVTGSGDIAAFIAKNTGSTDVVATITVTPISAAFAYVANANRISIVNTGNNTVVGNIPVGTTPYAVAATPDGQWIYVANQASSNVSVISTVSNTVIKTIPTGNNPAGIAVSPDGSTIYVVNGTSNDVSVIRTSDNTLFTTIKVGISPVGIAFSPDGTKAYVSNRNANNVAVINTASYTVLNYITVGKSPESMAMLPDGSLLYVANYNSNNVSVISTETGTVISSITVGVNPRGITISPDGGRAYVSNFGSNSVSVINTLTNSLIKTIVVGTSPQGISISPNGALVYVANYASTNISVIDVATNAVTGTIPLGAQPVSFGNFITGGSGCSGDPKQFTITVTPASSYIDFNGTLAPLTTTYGTPSKSTKFNVIGVNMTAGILVVPPNGFEVSTDDVTFKSSLTVGAAGTIPATPVYIRLAAKTPAGTYFGDVVLSSAGTGNTTVPTDQINTVNPAKLTITAENKTKAPNADNPVLTVKYNSFVNNETAADLTAQPIITTTATKTSAIGSYTITVNGATSPNYTIDYAEGVLTISATGQLAGIPNTFTPNGDGINDTWELKNITLTADITVNIYDRYGTRVFSSIGYGVAWNGTVNGKGVPVGTYYYIIDLKDNQKPISGSVTVLR
jgi:gliding motility-associated-like protein